MEDKKLNLNNAIKEIREIKMTALEKEVMSNRIMSSPPAPLKPIATPYKFYSVYASMCCLLIVLGSGVAFASQGSLPGDKLYSLKTKVMEPLYGSLLFSPVAKAQYQNELANKRLTEVETLKGKKNKNKQPEVSGEKEKPNYIKVKKKSVKSALDTTKESLDVTESDIPPSKKKILEGRDKTLDKDSELIEEQENIKKDEEKKEDKNALIAPILKATNTLPF